MIPPDYPVIIIGYRWHWPVFGRQQRRWKHLGRVVSCRSWRSSSVRPRDQTRINHALVIDRERAGAGRAASPTAAFIQPMSRITTQDGDDPGFSAAVPLHRQTVCGQCLQSYPRTGACPAVAVEIVSKIKKQVGFLVLLRRWVMERTIARLNRKTDVSPGHRSTLHIPLRRRYHATRPSPRQGRMDPQWVVETYSSLSRPWADDTTE